MTPAPSAVPLARRSGLPSLRAAFEHAARPLQDGEPVGDDVLESLWRIARAIGEDEAAVARPELQAAVAAVLTAGGEQVAGSCAALLALLDRVTASTPAELILVVEDEALSARSLEVMLAAPGRRIVLADTVAAARAALAREVPSLVVLDLILPDGDGRSLLLELRSDPRTAAVPVVVLTARLGATVRAECYALGADGYFEKPVEPESFAVAVSSRLERHARLAQLARRDPVTGLPNRAAFLETWHHFAGLQPAETPCALAVMDLDHFRWVGERWGRQFADAVMRRTGVRISMALRSAACLARWDGAEFIAMFRGKRAEEARALVEQALVALRRVDFRAGEAEPLLLTFSAGVSELGNGITMDDALAEADRLRHLAKESGRNQVLSGAPREAVPARRILFAEDDPDVVRMVTRHLRAEGFEVVHCPDGRQALELAPGCGASLLISDIEMPELDGLGLLQGIRAHPMLRHLPVMMLTAMGDDQHIVRAFELGADDYVIKPFSVREVAARARRLLRRPSLAALPLAF
ncbi:MAG: response regulator [Gemmatimonadetes bacterium]|nr:response regulator [Gemmatimonadota bacterium]